MYRKKYTRKRRYQNKRRRPYRTQKRRYNRKRRNAASKVVVRNVSIIPDRYFCKMRYDQTYVLGSSGFNYVYNVFRGNALYDPDLTGTGHQPLGFDEMSNLYNKYVVFGSTFKCRFSNDTGNTYQLAIFPSLSPSTIPATIDTVAEQIYSKRTMMNGGDGLGLKTLSGYMSTRKMFGLKKITDEDDNYTSVKTTNPVNQFYWIAYAYSPNNSPFGSGALVVQTEMTFYVEFFNRVQFNSS